MKTENITAVMVKLINSVPDKKKLQIFDSLITNGDKKFLKLVFDKIWNEGKKRGRKSNKEKEQAEKKQVTKEGC